MPNNKDVLKKQIKETANSLGLEEFVIEKDLQITKILHGLTDLEDKYFELIFQGGTALAKGGVVPRMSEDLDYRVSAKKEASKLGRQTTRKHLRNFRRDIVEEIKKMGFSFISEPRVVYEGRYMSLKLEYKSLFSEATSSLNPYLAVDFFVAKVKDNPINRDITTLIQETIGEQVEHQTKTVKCMSLTETAAEKWIGLTRRIATIKHRNYYNDPALVRHIYDLYKIGKQITLDNEFNQLVYDILQAETGRFKAHNEDYFKEPVNEIKRSISVLKEDAAWEENWNMFIRNMVFEENPPTYKEAINNFLNLSKNCIAFLESK